MVQSLLFDSHVLRMQSLAQEFNIEKLQLLEAEKAKIRKDYERREGQIDVKKKMYVTCTSASLSSLKRAAVCWSLPHAFAESTPSS